MNVQMFYWLSLFLFLVIFEIGKKKKNLKLALIIAILTTTILVFFKQNIYLEFSTFLLTAIFAYSILKFYEKNKTLRDCEPFDFHGKRGIVVEPVAPFKIGYVKIDGINFSAESLRNTSIEVGAIVEVIGASSCHIVVEKIREY